MLKNINPLLTPNLLKILMEMGHGDQIVIADANFPSSSLAKNLVRMDGIPATDILEAIMSVLPLDTYKEYSIALMAHGEEVEAPDIWGEFNEIIENSSEKYTEEYVERFLFYEQAQKSYAIVASGEKRLYANIILTKGVL